MSRSQSPAFDRDAATIRDPAGPPARRPYARGMLGRRQLSVVLAVLAGALVVLAGTVVANSQSTTYTATSQLLLAPKTQRAASVASGLYDTLSSGQLPATAAAIIQEKRFLRSALAAQDVTGTEGVAVEVTVVPATAIVEVQVTAPSSRLAVQLADEIPRQAVPKVNAALVPFELIMLGSAEKSPPAASLSTSQWIVLVGIAAAVVAGIVLRLLRPRGQRPGELEV